MKIAGVIIAGGHSARMGREKALVEIAGKPIIRWIADRLAPQVAVLAINVNGTSLLRFGLPVIVDCRTDIGTPLAGLHTALRWAREQGIAEVLTVPSDSPFIPLDLAERLGGKGAAVAASGGREHFLTGRWPPTQLELLERALDGGLRRVQDWAGQCKAERVSWPTIPFDPFFNVNTPEDLAKAEFFAAEFNP